MTDKKKRKRRKRSRIGYYLYAVTALILMLAIIALSTLLLFHVQKMEVKGTKYTDSNEILRWVQEDQYVVNSIYACVKFKMGDYEKPIYLEDVKMRMKAPWSLVVEVKEKEIVGGILLGSAYAYFDADGLLMLTSTEILENILIIEGVEAESTGLYERLSVDNDKIFQYTVNLSEELEESPLEPDRIVWEDNGMNLYFGEVRVQLGRTDFGEKLLQLPPVLKELEGKRGVLHMEYYNEMSTNITFEKEVEQNP